jgi:AraC-like DNA-binding protein
MWCYRLLATALGREPLNPTALIGFAVRNMVSGFVSHDEYFTLASLVEQRPPPERSLLDSVRGLVGLDANPLAALLRNAGSEAQFVQRWNVIDQHLELGVSTRLGQRLGTPVRRQPWTDPDSRLRRTVMEMFTEQLRDEALKGCDRPLDVDLETLVRTLGAVGVPVGDLIAGLRSRPTSDLVSSAGLLGCSARTVQRQLSRLNVSFQQVRRAVRVERATQLLRFTDLPMTEVALAAGFYDAPHFNRAVRLSTTVCPTAYRTICSRVEVSPAESR